MQTAISTAKTKTKIRKASTIRVKAEQTFQKWLAEEVAAGRIIGPKNTMPTPKPKRPESGLDWHSAYEYARSDKF